MAVLPPRGVLWTAQAWRAWKIRGLGKPKGAITGLFWSLKKAKKRYDRSKKVQARNRAIQDAKRKAIEDSRAAAAKLADLKPLVPVEEQKKK